ncbi:MAG TPA: apolipoprotein N-acyltransferase [Streptosporangiaceae bacterium]
MRLTGTGGTSPAPAAPAPAGLRASRDPGGGPDAARPALRARFALPAALIGGLALAGAFPPVGIWPFAALGPALLTVALWRQRTRTALAVGAVFGVAFFVPLISWLLNVAWYVWAALAIAETIVFTVLVLGQLLLLRLRAWPLAVACWWVAAEAVRDRWPWAFPWGRLAMSQAGAPTQRWVAIGGPPLLTFLLALAGACLAWLLLTGVRPWRRLLLPGLALAASAAVALGGQLLPLSSPASGGPSATIAAIQGNVPHSRSLPDQLRAHTVTANHEAATLRLAAQVAAGTRPAPDLVIWPENSTDIDPATSARTNTQISTAVAAIGRPVLVGAVLDNPLRNAGQLWLPGRGPVQVYVKRQLVPFGEYIPLRGFLDKFTSLPSLQPVNFTPGHKAVVFHVGPIRLGDVICYEVGFDNLVASEVTAGANVLSVQTNDADFELDGQTGETLQQLAMARIRAVETDRSVVVASTTGESAIIAPDGSLLARTGTWQRAVLDQQVPLRTGLTLAMRLGGWPEGVLSAAAVALLGWVLAGAWLTRRRARTLGGPSAGPPSAGLGPREAEPGRTIES